MTISRFEIPLMNTNTEDLETLVATFFPKSQTTTLQNRFAKKVVLEEFGRILTSSRVADRSPIDTAKLFLNEKMGFFQDSVRQMETKDCEKLTQQLINTVQEKFIDHGYPDPEYRIRTALVKTTCHAILLFYVENHSSFPTIANAVDAQLLAFAEKNHVAIKPGCFLSYESVFEN